MSDLESKLIAILGPPRKGSKVDVARARQGVGKTSEWKRVAALPRRALDVEASADLTPLFEVARSTCTGCELCRDRQGAAVRPTLRPAQSAMLVEAEAAQGLVAFARVGAGKELSALLLPDALNSKRAVLLTKARLKSQMLERDRPRYGRHFRLRPVITLRDLPRAPKGLNDKELPEATRAELAVKDRKAIVRAWPEGTDLVLSYSELSHAAHGDILQRIGSLIDATILNECHCLRNPQSARSRRYRAAMRAYPIIRICLLSGTMGSKTIKDYAWLLDLTLRRRSPLPATFNDIDDWARGLDRPEDRGPGDAMDPGALFDLCGPGDLAAELDVLKPVEQELFLSAGGEPEVEAIRRKVARAVYGRRLRETRGVVVHASATGDCDATLVLQARPVDVPEVVKAALAELRKFWSIGGEDLDSAAAVALKARQLCAGFYYRYVWPDGQPDREWLAAKKAWAQRVRHVLQYQPETFRDSPLLVMRAVQRGEVQGPELDAWLAVRDRWPKGPPRESVWLSEFLVDDCEAWCREREKDKEPGILWYGLREFGEALVRRGLRVFCDGDDGLLGYEGPHACANPDSYSDGLNLQHFNRQYFSDCPSGDVRWEQALGRSHRPGQRADEVVADVAVHDEVLRNALRSAVQYARQKLEDGTARPKVLTAVKINLDFLDGA